MNLTAHQKQGNLAIRDRLSRDFPRNPTEEDLYVYIALLTRTLELAHYVPRGKPSPVKDERVSWFVSMTSVLVGQVTGIFKW